MRLKKTRCLVWSLGAALLFFVAILPLSDLSRDHVGKHDVIDASHDVTLSDIARNDGDAANKGKPSCNPPPPNPVYCNGAWQCYEDPPNKFGVYARTAFLDTRPLGGALPYVRIFVMQRRNHTLTTCHLWYSGATHPRISNITVTQTTQSFRMVDRTIFRGQLYTCQLPVSDPLPEFVSLVRHRCDQASIHLKVEIPQHPPQPLHEVGICVALTYGKLNATQLVEWLETERVLGVSEFNVYDAGIESDDALNVLEYYKHLGVLNLRPWEMVLSNAKDRYESMKLGMSVGLNDCMYRNLYRYRYALIIDFDELVVPRLDDTYSSMFERLLANDDTGLSIEVAPSFWSANAFFNNKLDTDGPAYLHKFRRTYRSFPGHVMPKSFFNPATCIIAHNHFCLGKFEQVALPLRQGLLPNISLTHHYRHRQKDTINSTYAHDPTLLRFQTKVDHPIRATLQRLGLLA